ncbi:MAG: flagellar biosynthesis protein FlgA [Alphaproteobacteria bacterium]|nr:flagellar biosynthesis protein FlgA [Alphaproteobacteria bacterium]MBT4083686.1 flagellar biosynthesis protein FlgA [Alphaproteobacteria bacterium]MBT4545208.1 flagellar biosynthesis protein FlgA [Alphaproteobacteria bacterium]MBT7744596.1 flagellar biosynthesis protein FlgA [Alphaproteobacteria bacterium]
MNFETLFAGVNENPVEAALIGVGEFGASLIAQGQRMPSLKVRVLCDQDTKRAQSAALACGIEAEHITVCENAASAQSAFARGDTVILPDATLINDLDIDIVVEATGVPEVAARNALAAIDHGRHVAMVSKEADSVVGSILHHRARAAGLTYTPIDGDQPSLLIGLVTWARILGLDIVTAGKSSEYDFVYDPDRQQVSWRDQIVDVPGFDKLWQLPAENIQELLSERADVLSDFPRRIVPDYCEMGVVCNALGLKPDRRDFHAPICRTVEVAEVLRPVEFGGVLERSGVVDVFNCLRRPDEASFAGGVFIVVRCSDEGTWKTLKGKGIPVSRANDHALLYNPQHLLGLEAPISILSAVRLGRSTGGVDPQPVVDLVARATTSLKAGTEFKISDPHHHTIAGIDSFLADAAPVQDKNPLPYYMALHHKLKRDVAAGEMITADVVDLPETSVLVRLRREQDGVFGMSGQNG